MARTRDWRRHQKARIRRRRAHFDTVRWAVETGDGRLIDIATEHPACECWQCRARRQWGWPSLPERRAAAVATFALSVEPVLLDLTYQKPMFNWGDEVEIDPMDETSIGEETR